MSEWISINDGFHDLGEEVIVCDKFTGHVFSDYPVIKWGIAMSGWISVNERKPDFETSVFVYCKYYGRYIGYLKQIDGANEGVWCNWDGECGLVPPTHWMPLPEPPND